MGFTDKLTDVVQSARGNDDEGADGDFIDEEELNEMQEEVDGEEEEVVEEEVTEEWDTAYQFATDLLEEDGFASGSEIAMKIMMNECRGSPMFRDRIEHGAETMKIVTDAASSIQELKDDGSSESYKKRAQELKNANEMIDQAQKLSGHEEEMAGEILDIAREGVSSITEYVDAKNTGKVDAGVKDERGG